MAERFEVVFLGTGSPLQNPDRCGNSQVIVAGGRQVMVDCGWGSARRLMPSGVLPASVDTLLLTHMHSDHITDIPDFLFQRWTFGSERPLTVYGPPGTAETMAGFMQALRLDIGYRTAHHGSKLHPAGIEVEVHEIPVTAAPAAFAELGGLVLESFEVDHFPVVPALGYRARFDGRTVVISGDTGACANLTAASRGADMLICEALNEAMIEQIATGLQAAGRTTQSGIIRDVPTYHISTTAVAELARDAGVGDLVLTHLIPSIPNDPARESQFTAGMAAIYAGPIRVARDAMRLPVTARGSSTP